VRLGALRAAAAMRGFSASYRAAASSRRWDMVLMPPPTATTAMPASTAYKMALTTFWAMWSWSSAAMTPMAKAAGTVPGAGRRRG
jgi:hypothetical protein